MKVLYGKLTLVSYKFNDLRLIWKIEIATLSTYNLLKYICIYIFSIGIIFYWQKLWFNCSICRLWIRNKILRGFPGLLSWLIVGSYHKFKLNRLNRLMSSFVWGFGVLGFWFTNWGFGVVYFWKIPPLIFWSKLLGLQCP